MTALMHFPWMFTKRLNSGVGKAGQPWENAVDSADGSAHPSILARGRGAAACGNAHKNVQSLDLPVLPHEGLAMCLRLLTAVNFRPAGQAFSTSAWPIAGWAVWKARPLGKAYEECWQ